MRQLFYAIACGFFLVLPACNTSNNNNNPASDSLTDKKESAVNTLTFNNREFKIETIPDCDSCPKVTVTVPVAAGDEAVAKRINDSVFAAVQKVLGEEGKQFTNYDSLLGNFMNMYKQMKAELSEDAVIGWEATVKGNLVKQTDSLINIKLETYTMTGGAHPNTNTFSLLFDPATGNQLLLNDVIKNVPALTVFAEKNFREEFKIPVNASINSTMFTFENDKFVLPQNIFFNNDGLLLHYNPYEIGPYVIGAQELKLPYAEIKNYLAVQP
jgi:hypothetical protein